VLKVKKNPGDLAGAVPPDQTFHQKRMGKGSRGQACVTATRKVEEITHVTLSWNGRRYQRRARHKRKYGQTKEKKWGKLRKKNNFGTGTGVRVESFWQQRSLMFFWERKKGKRDKNKRKP